MYHDHLKDRRRRVHVDDEIGSDENVLEIHVLVHDGDGFLLDDAEQFRFL